MESREIKMADGRYLIYYTFEDEAVATKATTENTNADEPETVPQKEESARV